MQPTPRTTTTPLTPVELASQHREVASAFAACQDKPTTPLSNNLVLHVQGDSYEPASFILPRPDVKALAEKGDAPVNTISLS